MNHWLWISFAFKFTLFEVYDFALLIDNLVLLINLYFYFLEVSALGDLLFSFSLDFPFVMGLGQR